MRILLGLLLSASLILATFALPFELLSTSTIRRCSNQITDEQVQLAVAKLASVIVPAHLFRPQPTNVTFNVYWHIISANNTREGGFIPNSQINAQIDVLNDSFGSTGLGWNLAQVTRTTNATWFEEAGPDSRLEQDMKSTLRQGGPADLNVYSVGFRRGTGEGLLGYATFPWDYSNAPTLDGVVLVYSSLPGGDATNYNQGKTLVHEVGHWLGLLHTFQGGCNGGDSVDDTPAEDIPAEGCPVGRDTCPNLPGLDPIDNFMDYSFDACMTRFTPGQAQRARQHIRAFRGVAA
ncbi:hypothetical protein AX16_007966 [Volvariella volvacea WC 439]|nr:hypothetical protein AX16_007966 [Volvariella volvacea WC 439]